MSESRVKKSLLNAKVNMLFYFFSIAISFYSRKIFLEYLGADFLGLTGALGSILQYLNLAELGIGTAIAFNLYKPLHKKDYETLNELMSLFRYLYKNIGILITTGAVLISIFFPLIFNDAKFEFALIYYAFFSLLFSALIGYFVNYRTILLTADQKEYHLTKYTETTRIITTILQMVLLYKTRNLYLFLSINILLAIVNSYIINLKLDKEYPFLKPNASNGKKLKKKYPHIFQSVKQVFIHKVKDTVIHGSDQLFILAFESLKMIAYYGNYTLVSTRIMQFFISSLNSFGAGVGNLISEGNKIKIHQVFWELMAIRYFIAGVSVFLMYHLMNPFITLWLGEEYLLGKHILLLMLIVVFIAETRGVVDMFNNAFGNYGDINAAWVELGINISVTLVAGYYLGLAGILIGKIISQIVIVVFWKPLYLFRKGFSTSVFVYWKGTIMYYFVFAVSIGLSYVFQPYITINPNLNFLNLIMYSVVLCLGFSILYGVQLIFFTLGTKDVLLRLPFVKNILKK